MTAPKKVGIALVLTVIIVGVVAVVTEQPDEVAQSNPEVKSNYTQANINSDAPIVTTKTVEEPGDMVPFQTIEEPDPSLPAGQTVVARQGESGAKTVTYKITFHDGDAVKKEKVSEKISLEPVHEIKKVGTGTQ
jgi:uncharacterized protein YabE (DUF348 family)